MTESQLRDQLGDLAERLDVPDLDLGATLATGRRRRRRHRLALAGGATAVAVAVLGGAALAGSLTDIGADDGSRLSGRPTATSGSDAPADPERNADTEPTRLPLSTDSPSPFDIEDPLDDPAIDSQVMDMRRAVARHLDPDGAHISAAEIRMSNVQASGGDQALSSLGTRVGWREPGVTGQGAIEVAVSAGPSYSCEDTGVTCRADNLAGLAVTAVIGPDSEDPDVPTYAYERPDGYVVSVAVDDLYGNNSLEGVSQMSISDEALADLLRDPAFDLPGHPAVPEPESLTAQRMASIARSVLGREDVTMGAVRLSDGGIRAAWDSGGTGGSLVLRIGPGNLDPEGPCESWFALRCTTQQVDGMPVRIDHRRKHTGGGYDVTVVGPTRTIWLYADPDDATQAVLPVSTAVRVATDPRLQE